MPRQQTNTSPQIAQGSMQGQSTAMHRVSSQRTMETAGGGCVRLVMIHMMQQLFFAVGRSTSTEVTLLLSILRLFVLLCGSIWHLNSQQPFIGKRRNLMFVFRIVQIHNMETELQFNKQRYKIHKTPVGRILCILYRKFLKNYNITAGQQGHCPAIRTGMACFFPMAQIRNL